MTTLGTLQGTNYRRLDGTAGSGKVVISTNVAGGDVRDPVGNVIWSGTLEVPIVDGTWSVQVPPTDDATLSAVGFVYIIEEQLGHKPRNQWRTVTTPAPAGSTVNMADLATGAVVPPTNPEQAVTLTTFLALQDQVDGLPDTIPTPEEIAAAAATPSSPVATSVDPSLNTLTGGGASGGKRVTAGKSSTGKTVFEIATEESPNGYTTLNLFPATSQSRSKLSVWAKSPSDLAPGETNRRLYSMEGHSVAEEGVSHCTMYAQMTPGMTTQNGRGTVAAGGPLQDYQGHVFQFATEGGWDNRFELLTFLQAKGGFPDDLWQTATAVYAGVTDVGAYPTLQLATSNANQLNRIQNRSGVFEFVTGSSGSIKFNSPGGQVLTGGQVYVDDSSTGMRVRGILPTTDPLPFGVYIGRQNSDVNQPKVTLANGTTAQDATLDNRSGRLRLIVGGTVPIAVEASKVGFYGVTPVARAALAAAATDAATTQTLVNDIRAKLVAVGLFS